MDTEFDWSNPNLVAVPIRSKNKQGEYKTLDAIDVREVSKEVFDNWARSWCESQGIECPEDLSEAVFDDPKKRLEFIDLFLSFVNRVKK